MYGRREKEHPRRTPCLFESLPLTFYGSFQTCSQVLGPSSHWEVGSVCLFLNLVRIMEDGRIDTLWRPRWSERDHLTFIVFIGVIWSWSSELPCGNLAHAEVTSLGGSTSHIEKPCGGTLIPFLLKQIWNVLWSWQIFSFLTSKLFFFFRLDL